MALTIVATAGAIDANSYCTLAEAETYFEKRLSQELFLKFWENNRRFSVFFAEDGEEGLKIIEREKPDLILSDILMPKMDGVTMIKKLKEIENRTLSNS